MIPLVAKVAEPIATSWERLAQRGIEVLLVLVGLTVAHAALFFLIRRINRIVVRSSGNDAPEVKKRADTIASALRGMANVLILAAGAVYILNVMGMDIRPFLAGAGIVGVALGFGAQTLVKDVLSGMFILAEHQVSVGDTVQVGGVTGTVERVRIRAIVLRDIEGRVYYVPSGEIRIVTNLSQGAARFIVDVPIPSDADPTLALATVREAIKAFGTNPAFRGLLLEPPATLGFETLGAGQNTIRVTARALRQDAQIARELRYAVVVALAAKGIRAGGKAADNEGERR